MSDLVFRLRFYLIKRISIPISYDCKIDVNYDELLSSDASGQNGAESLPLTQKDFR